MYFPPFGDVSVAKVEMSFLTNEQTELNCQCRTDLVWAQAHDPITVKLAGVCVAVREQTIPNLALSHSGVDR